MYVNRHRVTEFASVAFLKFLSLAILVLIAFSIGAGCEEDKGSTVAANLNARLYTAEHDGHKFVVGHSGDSRGGVSVTHHPGCPCLTPVEKK